jgi:hypothetical protein
MTIRKAILAVGFGLLSLVALFPPLKTVWSLEIPESSRGVLFITRLYGAPSTQGKGWYEVDLGCLVPEALFVVAATGLACVLAELAPLLKQPRTGSGTGPSAGKHGGKSKT